jgi:hypothetical protein
MATAEKIVKTTVGLGYDAARQTGRYERGIRYEEHHVVIGMSWERDAVLEAAIVVQELINAEREACARECEDSELLKNLTAHEREGPRQCAEAIRARSEHDHA